MRRAPLLAGEQTLNGIPDATPEERAAVWRALFVRDALDIAEYLGLDGGDAA